MKKRKYASGSLLGTSTANSFGFNRTPAEKAVYGDPTQDPLQRVVGDITGNNIKSAINDMYGNLNTNVAPIDNNTLMDRLYNTPRYQKMDRVYNGDIIAGLGLVGSGTLPVAAGFRYGKGAKNGVLSIDLDNMMAAGQGAMNGSSYGPYGIAAGAILGGLSNYVSQLGINKRVDKWNNAVDTYNLAQNSITDQLINNSRLSQMNQYNSNYAKLGGPLNTHGGDFQNGVVEIANGGTHEENPYEGVPMGMDQKGVPNLVEEGEYIWNDYVFSKRIDVPEDMRKKYKFGGKLSFADAVDKVQRESEERPNDPISKRGLNAILSELAMSQEIERQKQQQQEAFENAENLASTFADGGNIHINKNKRGTFTAAATKHNMGVQEFARHVLANKDKYSSTMVKKANFAHNAAGWKHALGGNLFKKGSKLSRRDRKAAAEYLAADIAEDLRNQNIVGNPYIGYNGMLSATPEVVVTPDYNPFPHNWESYEGWVQPDHSESVINKNIGWAYTYPENRPKTWDGSLYNLPFYPSDSIDKTIVTTNGVGSLWEIPYDAPDNNPIISSAPNITGNEITLSSPLTSDFIYRPVVTNKSTPVIPTKELDKLSQPSEFEDFPSAEWTGPETPKKSENPKSKSQPVKSAYNKSPWQSPAFLGAIGSLLNNLRPIDYTNSDMVGNAARSINRYRGYNPLSGYMEYRPVDINALTARMNAQQAADRRALLNMSNGNPAAAALMALAARYNDSRGDMLSKVDEINTARRNAIAGFNTDINKTNSQLDLNAQQMNQRGEQMYLTGITHEAAMRDQYDAAKSAALSSTVNAAAQNLEDIERYNDLLSTINSTYPFIWATDDNGNPVLRYRAAKKGGKLFKVKR